MQISKRKQKTDVSRQLQGEVDGNEVLPHHYLLVAQGGVFTTPTMVQTVLGSCVSVTMFAPKYRWGGIFHALLPRRQDFLGRTAHGDHFRFVDSAIYALLKEFAKAGIYAADLECKVFGGASPLHQKGAHSAGGRNVDVAMEILAAEGLNVLASSVGGNGGRKIFFRTDSGLVLQKRFLVKHANIDNCGE